MLQTFRYLLALLFSSALLGCVLWYSPSYKDLLYSKELLSDVRDSSIVEFNIPQQLETSTIKTEKFHVILTFRLMEMKDERENSRMNEYVYCVKSFLNNSLVKQVHLMHDSPEMTGYIQKKTGAHPKLMLHRVESPDVVFTLHQFAFTHLQGEVVVITQADLILGEGFEKVNKTFLVENNLFYSLSRHERECFIKPNFCKEYVGSHDTFVFVPKGNIPEKGKELLSHLIFNLGTENVVMYVYLHILKYKIRNPCLILKVYHHHCSGLRKYTQKQIRINYNFSLQSLPIGELK